MRALIFGSLYWDPPIWETTISDFLASFGWCRPCLQAYLQGQQLAPCRHLRKRVPSSSLDIYKRFLGAQGMVLQNPDAIFVHVEALDPQGYLGLRPKQLYVIYFGPNVFLHRHFWA